MSASPPKADMFSVGNDVRLVPQADMNLAWVRVKSLLDRYQVGRTLVLKEDDEKLRGLRFAGVATDNVNVMGTFIEGLTRLKGDRIRPLELHDDGTFQHIDKCVRVVAMDWVCSTGRILDNQHRALFAGDVA